MRATSPNPGKLTSASWTAGVRLFGPRTTVRTTVPKKRFMVDAFQENKKAFSLAEASRKLAGFLSKNGLALGISCWENFTELFRKGIATLTVLSGYFCEKVIKLPLQLPGRELSRYSYNRLLRSKSIQYHGTNNAILPRTAGKDTLLIVLKRLSVPRSRGRL